jgi:hypothetical protein
MADNVHVHNPPSNGGSGGPGWIVALVAVVLLVLLVWFFFMRGGADTGPNVPDQIEVDINAPAGGTGGGGTP